MSDDLANFFERQAAAIHARDLDALLDQYAADVVFVRLDGEYRGLDEVRAMFGEYLAAEPRIVATHGSRLSGTPDDGVILYHAELALNGGHVSTVGTLVLRDGKIWRQTVVVVGPA